MSKRGTDATPKADGGDATATATQATSDCRTMLPSVLRHTALWFVLRVITGFALRRAGPAAFQSASPARQGRTVLYILSTVAAAIATVFSLLTDGRPTLRKRALLDSFIGYLVHDALAVLPEWRQNGSIIGHHVAVVALTGYVRTRFHALFDIAAPMMRLESSTVFLNAFWFTREYPDLGRTFPRAVAALPTVFLHAFFWIRVAWLPYYAWWMDTYHRRRFRSFGAVAHTGLAGLILVQFYWFALILAKLRRTPTIA